MQNEKTYIIGAGLAGLSAAYHLTKAGHKDIAVLEASPHIGGRCRSFYDDRLKMEIDNGNHLLMGANKHTLELIKELGIDERFHRFDGRIFTFFNNRKGERYYFKPPFPDMEIYGISGFLNFIRFIALPAKGTVKQAFRLSPILFDEIINPISRSILNTPSDIADAGLLRRTFLKIITSRKGFSYYYPKKSWDDALIKPLVEILKNSGVEIKTGMAVKDIQNSASAIYRLIVNDDEIDVSDATVILAVPPSVAAKHISITVPTEFYPIINIHFKVEHILEPQIIGVIESNIEWVFVKPGLVSTTFSAAGAKLNEAEMVKEAWATCYKVLGLKGDLPPYQVIVEKRATFAATKEQLAKRPKNKTKYKNLFLAGDYTRTGLPATIEGAIISGKKVCDQLNS